MPSLNEHGSCQRIGIENLHNFLKPIFRRKIIRNELRLRLNENGFCQRIGIEILHNF